MPKLSQIQKANETVNVSVDFGGGEPLELTVYLNRITGKRRREMEALADLEDDDLPEGETVADRSAALLFDVIKKWDLTDDDGKVLPFNADTADLLSVPTMTRIYTEIGEATNPNLSKTSKRSRGR